MMFGEPCPWIIQPTAETFEKEVIERSLQTPVIVDFWAPWCEPCKLLGPTLEKLAEEGQGKFILAKIDVDQSPEIAQWFGVQQIPVVFAIQGGQAVDQFMGNVPEAQIREWLQQFQPSPLQILLRDAATLEATSATEADAKYREALELEKDNPTAKIGLTRVLMAQHRDEEARALIAEMEARGFLEPEAQPVKAELELRAAALETGGVPAARAAVAAQPENLDLQLQLADTLAASHAYPEALEICLNLVKQHRATMGEKAKTTMVQIFQALGASSELAQQYRRKLSTALY
ncbi:MAG: trxA 2 [Planctomycetaceae bacterium]|nr:trxA 2 [Planctomycetaceae bacterium]